MRILVFSLIASSILFAGCDLKEIKDAAADINNAAENASVATSEEVHSIRAIELTHNNETFTVNDLFKGILRDVYWHYEQVDEYDILEIKGTWQPALFANYGLTLEQYPELDVTGDVVITIAVVDGIIQDEQTTVSVIYEEEELLNEQGTTILTDLYDEYTKNE